MRSFLLVLENQESIFFWIPVNVAVLQEVVAAVVMVETIGGIRNRLKHCILAILSMHGYLFVFCHHYRHERSEKQEKKNSSIKNEK